MHGRPAQLEVQVVQPQLPQRGADVALDAVAELIVAAAGLLIFDERLAVDVSLGQPRERGIELQADAQPAVACSQAERVVAHVADVAVRR